MLRYSLAALTGLLLSMPAWADNWTDGLFEQTAKDFGSVPRGPVLTHPFRIVNNTPVTVRVVRLRVSCGCVIARMDQPELVPGQGAEVVAEMHTDRFLGDKTVSVFVTFDRPQFAEVALQVKARSCDDVAVNPETLDFGRLPHGQAGRAKTVISLPGVGEYRIEKATADSEHVRLTLTEMPSEQANKVYQLTADLDNDLPVGKWYTEVWLHTNHPWMERIRIPVRADVEAVLAVSPDNTKLEVPAPGARVQRKVLVHGSAPFAILSVKGTDSHWSVHDDTPGRSPRHILTITLETLPGEGRTLAPVGGPPAVGVMPPMGLLEHSFQVITDLPGEGMVQIHAQADGGR